MKEQNRCKIAAVVVTYNRKELLRECLTALLAQTRPLDEIIVVDNASSDGTDQMIAEQFPQVTYVRLPENIGGAGGFHEGMKLAYQKGYDWIWVMDDDAVTMPDALEHIIRSDIIQNQNVYALASAVLYPDKKICDFHRRRFDPLTAREHPVELSRYNEDYFEVDTASFVGMLVNRRAIDKCGFPLKEFFIYYDDTEYSLRLRRSGGKIFTIPKSRIVHLGGGKSENINPRRAAFSWRTYYGRRNMIYTLRKYSRFRIAFYIRLIISTLKSQIGVILFRDQKWSSTKILWISLIDGIRGKLGRKSALDQINGNV